VVVNEREDCPADPYTAERVERLTVKMAKTPSDFDKLRQFLEMDRKVLRYYCMLDDRDRLFGQFKKFILHVRLTLHHLSSSSFIIIITCLFFLSLIVTSSSSRTVSPTLSKAKAVFL